MLFMHIIGKSSRVQYDQTEGGEWELFTFVLLLLPFEEGGTKQEAGLKSFKLKSQKHRN
jgi:hypothetical protein